MNVYDIINERILEKLAESDAGNEEPKSAARALG